MDIRNNYINGQWQASVSGGTREIINPGNGEVLALVTDSVAEDSKQAIAAAKAAFYQSGAWRRIDRKSVV